MFPSPCRGGRCGRRGTILFLAIGAVAVLSILALGATSSVMQEMRLARAVTQTNEAFYATEAACPIARMILTHDDTPMTVTIHDLQPRLVAFGGRTMEITMRDEQALIPLVLASGEVLARLPGIDGDGALAGNLAEANIQTKEDALSVSGVTPEIYAKFKDYVTTFSTGGVNINTAEPAILLVLGMNDELVEKIVAFRAGSSRGAGPPNDGVLLTPDEIVPRLQAEAGITEKEAEFLGSLVTQGKLCTSSDFIRVEASLIVGQSKRKCAAAIVHLASSALVAWYEE